MTKKARLNDKYKLPKRLNTDLIISPLALFPKTSYGLLNHFATSEKGLLLQIDCCMILRKNKTNAKYFDSKVAIYYDLGQHSHY